MTKRAVCVGINDYSNRADCPVLGDALQDAQAWARLLPDAFGFDAANVSLITDQSATQAAVLSALTTMLAASSPGDVACFFFAGHGGRDPTGDGSTYFESLCRADAGGDITDTQINELAAALKPSEVNFTLVLDSCHAGGVFDPPSGGMRSVAWSVDKSAAFAASCRAIVPHTALSDPAAVDGNVSQIERSATGALTMQVDDALNFSDAAKATLICACRYDQNADGTGSHGKFTQSLLDVINASNFQIDHTSLLDKVRSAILAYSPQQTPQLRGRPIRLEEKFLSEWNYSV